LNLAKKNGHIDKKIADRRRAVLLTAQAQAAEAEHPDYALELASEAHGLAPDLIPAGAIAGRVLAARGQTPKAAKVIQRTWKLAPHPELALAYAYARPGDSPSDRLARIRQLAATNLLSVEGPIAVATIAIESRDWEAARSALQPLVEKGLTQRVATLMAHVEGEGFNNAGRVREWLARSVHAERDPAWTADGVVADQWSPVSPVTGALDAFAWRVPVSNFDQPGAALIAERMDALVRLGTNPSLSPPTTAAQREPATVEIVPEKAKVAQPSQTKRTADDWLHDDDDQSPHTRNGSGPKSVIAKPPATKPSTDSVTVSKLAPKSGATATLALPRAPDDPGLEPLDSTTAKSQLERYRLIGAKT
jgi:HemY protein